MSVKAAIPKLLAAIPTEWRGTTFNNSNLLGRAGFCRNVKELLASGDTISTERLVGLGNAEDYLRVSSNFSTLLELALAEEKGYDVDRVFSFASTKMPIIAVLFSSKSKVDLYIGKSPSPFTPSQQTLLRKLGCNFDIHATAPVSSTENVVIALQAAITDSNVKVDGTIAPNVIYIDNPERIVPADILTMRKRMSTPLTTPMAEERLQRLAGIPVTANTESADDDAIAGYNAHLQQMSGTEVNTSSNPVSFIAGLAALASMWVTLEERGGADILMASTAYGGSSQATDIITGSASSLRKHKFHVQGSGQMIDSIKEGLAGLLADSANLRPLTVLFTEIPTNPDMKVPDMAELTTVLKDYKRTSGKEVLLLVDSTFAPASQVVKKLHALDPELNVMVFISLSKSVSRGVTTAGTILAGHTATSESILQGVKEAVSLMDTGATRDQMVFLTQNHTGVEERCLKAYDVAVKAGDSLKAAVLTHTNQTMRLAFVAPEQAKQMFTTSTFSFNLPSPANATDEVNEGLAQRFVDLLTVHDLFKPCVSFGQDNGLVYCTVPATSTQGAISVEDKSKQAVGGVQLVRLSFPPTIDTEKVCAAIRHSVASIYGAATEDGPASKKAKTA